MNLHRSVCLCLSAFVDAVTSLPTVVFRSSNILYYTMLVFNTMLAKASKVIGIQCWFSALPLTCRDFYGFSESYNDIMDYTNVCSKHSYILFHND